MRIPRIKLTIDRLIHEADKAYLFYRKGKEFWVPKSMCEILGGGNTPKKFFKVLLHPRKFQEQTGVIPQALDTFKMAVANSAYDLDNHPIRELKGYALFPKQKTTIEKVYRLKYCALICEMRTGKTVMSLTIANSRLKAGLIDRIIVIAPLRAKIAWQDYDIPFEFYPIEHFSNIHTRVKIQLNCDTKTMVILDESHKIKNDKVKRQELIINETITAGFKMILTGTPIGKHAGDLFYQFAFLSKDILRFNSYSDFSESHLLYGGRDGSKVVAYANIEEIAEKISPYVALLNRSDLWDEKLKIKKVFVFKLSCYKDYKEQVDEMRDLVTENKTVHVLGAMVKLQQMASNDANRIEKLKEMLDDRPTVIYYKFEKEGEVIDQLEIPRLSGKTSNMDFAVILNDFNYGAIKRIAIQQSISQGFSLKKASRLIYYSTTFNLLDRAQSEERASENREEIEVADIVAEGTIDERIQDVLNLKTTIVKAFKDETKSRSGR